MAVYTEVSDEALAGFLANYDLGAVLSFKGIAGGVENTNYLLRTESGTYILTLYEKRVAEKDLPFFVGLMDHLASRGFVCPLPIRNRHGSALGRLENRPAAIVSFLEGMEVSHPTPAYCHLAGQTMANLHQSASGFDIQRRNALAPAGWPALVESAIGEADSVEQGMADLIRGELAHAQYNWPQDIPFGVIHADLFKDNVFFLDGQLSGVIDFYFACNDYLAYDLAIGINAWCFDDDLAFQQDACDAMIAGYQSVRQLSIEETNALPTLLRGAALRFLLTRLNDWLNVPPGALVVPHDPKAFSARLKFFKTASAGKLGLA
ncbi:MAG: homoserine kinase [Rhizobiaceae bacterium]